MKHARPTTTASTGGGAGLLRRQAATLKYAPMRLPVLMLVLVMLLTPAPYLRVQVASAGFLQWPFGIGSSSSPSTSSTSTSSSSTSATNAQGGTTTTTSQTTTTTTTTITSGSSAASPSAINLIRLRSNKLRRPESCRESLPRKSDELPQLVITGRVREVYLAGVDSLNQLAGQLSVAANANTNKALVTVGRVIKGNQQLVATDIIVSGFNSTNATPCPNYVKPNDTLILLLEHEFDKHYSIHGGHLLPMNLANLDRINTIAADEPHKRRGPIEDILCEAKYCPYGRCVVVNEQAGEVACKCPESCVSLAQPVCGSDNVTYTNECHLIKEGCARQRPLFVTKESAC